MWVKLQEYAHAESWSGTLRKRFQRILLQYTYIGILPFIWVNCDIYKWFVYKLWMCLHSDSLLQTFESAGILLFFCLCNILYTSIIFFSLVHIVHVQVSLYGCNGDYIVFIHHHGIYGDDFLYLNLVSPFSRYSWYGNATIIFGYLSNTIFEKRGS